MKIEKATNGEFVAVRLTGELRTQEAVEFTEELHALVAESVARVAVDLSGLSMIDSAGLCSLINLVTHARLSGSAVVLVNPSVFVRGVFEVTRLDAWFEIFPDMETAKGRLLD